MSWSESGATRRRFLAGALLSLGLALPAAGCGYQPVYGRRGGGLMTRTEMAEISVPEQGTRLGQLVWVPLMDRLNPTGREVAKRFRLDMALSESESGVLITRGDTTTRINLNLTAGFNLIDLKSNTSLFSGVARAVASYNVLTSDYANLTGYDDARQRAAIDLAEQIALRLGVFFSEPPKA